MGLIDGGDPNKMFRNNPVQKWLHWGGVLKERENELSGAQHPPGRSRTEVDPQQTLFRPGGRTLQKSRKV